MPRYKIQRTTIISGAETKQMIDDTPTLRDKAMIAVLYLYGCRPTELRTLTREDFYIDGEKLWLRIHTAKTRMKKGSSPILRSKRNIFAFLKDNFTTVILDYIKICPYGEKIFVYGNSEKTSNSNMDRILKSTNPNCCAYVFRHTRNTILAEEGATESQLMGWNGWRDGRPAGNYVKGTKRLVENIPNRPTQL